MNRYPLFACEIAIVHEKHLGGEFVMRKRFLIEIGVVVVLILMVGVLPVLAQGQPKKGGTLKVISTGGDVRCLGYAPDVRLLYQMIYSQPVTETLLRWDKKGELAPHLAETWKFSPDLRPSSSAEEGSQIPRRDGFRRRGGEVQF